MLRPASGPDSASEGAPLFTRRRILVAGGRGLLVLGLLGGAATACGSSEPPGPDPLEAELQAARRDSDLAAAAAKAAPPALAPALSEIAAERGRHATALIEELARAAGKPTPTAEESATQQSAAQTASPAPTPAPRPPTVKDVAAALRSSADSAAKLAPTLSGYRAGLLGSIAAACTTSYTVGLPPPTRPR